MYNDRAKELRKTSAKELDKAELLLQELKLKVHFLNESHQERNENLKQRKQAPGGGVVGAFVTFQNEHTQVCCLDRYRTSGNSVARACQPASLRFPSRQGQKYPLWVCAAPEPEDIRWENLTDTTRTWAWLCSSARKLVSFMMVVFFLSVSFAALHMVSTHQRRLNRVFGDVTLCQLLPADSLGHYNYSLNAPRPHNRERAADTSAEQLLFGEAALELVPEGQQQCEAAFNTGAEAFVGSSPFAEENAALRVAAAAHAQAQADAANAAGNGTVVFNASMFPWAVNDTWGGVNGAGRVMYKTHSAPPAGALFLRHSSARLKAAVAAGAPALRRTPASGLLPHLGAALTRNGGAVRRDALRALGLCDDDLLAVPAGWRTTYSSYQAYGSSANANASTTAWRNESRYQQFQAGSARMCASLTFYAR